MSGFLVEFFGGLIADLTSQSAVAAKCCNDSASFLSYLRIKDFPCVLMATLEHMTADEVGEWLKQRGFSEDIVEAFEGQSYVQKF